MTARYERPSGAPATLSGPPVLESWNAEDHPEQVRLAAYLQDVADLVDKLVAPEATALAIELSVGLEPGVSVTGGGRDLDNYAFPLLRKLGERRFDAVFVTKHNPPPSTLTIGPAVPCSGEPGGMHVELRTTGSSESAAWKQQIHDACAKVAAAPLNPGPLAVDIAFSGSHQRNWSTLWKPAIDALGPLLGFDPARPFHPDDDRIVDLALHWHPDDSLVHDVVLDVWAGPAVKLTARH